MSSGLRRQNSQNWSPGQHRHGKNFLVVDLHNKLHSQTGNWPGSRSILAPSLLDYVLHRADLAAPAGPGSRRDLLQSVLRMRKTTSACFSPGSQPANRPETDRLSSEAGGNVSMDVSGLL